MREHKGPFPSSVKKSLDNKPHKMEVTTDPRKIDTPKIVGHISKDTICANLGKFLICIGVVFPHIKIESTSNISGIKKIVNS
ncbi:MAG: hypothetical protein P8X46_07215 [Nitrospirales bacterium]